MSQAKSKSKSKPKAPAAVPASEAEKCFHKLQAVIAAVPLADTKPITVDVQLAASVALGVYDVLHQPEHAPVIEALAKTGTIDRHLIDGLADIARAAWYARHKVLVTGAVVSEAQLPVSLLEPALECRARMRKALEYNLEGDVQADTILAQLRLGTGHLDLANDLLGYADLYRRYNNDVVDDRKNYRDGDEALARKLADDITTALGVTGTPDQAIWKGHQSRAFVLLQKHYEEAVRLGRFLYFYEGAEELFPSLFTACRTAPAPREKPEAPPQEGGDTGKPA
jgi:hypothetical protein